MRRTIIAIITAAVIAGCSLRPPATRRDSVRYMTAPSFNETKCAAIDRRVMGFTATAVAMGAASGATGITSIFTDGTHRTATASTSVTVAILSAVFTYLSNAESQIYTQGCTINTGGQPTSAAPPPKGP